VKILHGVATFIPAFSLLLFEVSFFNYQSDYAFLGRSFGH